MARFFGPYYNLLLSTMRFDIITIFPEIINAYLNESIIKRARERGLLDVCVHNLRNFTDDKHHKVDDRPFGGGPGMVMKVEPIVKAIEKIIAGCGTSGIIVVFLDAGGKQFDAKRARQFSKKYNHIILIAGRYEGMDARLLKILKANSRKLTSISIGPYVLTGGELPALVVLDAISRHIPGVLGKEESLEEKRHGVGVLAYTRPEVFEYKGKKYRVPKVLLSGDHKRVEDWRKKKR